MGPDMTMGDKKPDNPFPIVGIGASAGGLHSLECFLEALPKNFDFAVVFIQHLSPAHKSLMPEILRSKWRDHEFIEIEDGIHLVPGRIYLCPPAIEVRIREGAFRIIARPDEHIHFPIDEFLVSLAEDAAERTAGPIRQQPALDELQSVIQLSQETLLEEYAPAAVTIDQNYNILYHNGPTKRYLNQPRGAPTRNLLELIPENLRSRIRGAIYKVTMEAGPFSIRTSSGGDEGQKRQVSIRVSKIKDNLFLIVFSEKEGPPSGASSEYLETVCVEETAVRQLEIELSATRQELQTTIEQLKSLNEELQSSNEELQAANEELETSREELQSLNEELITVNAQLQSKVEEQEETNNDLNNFLSSTNIPTIFLDHRFRVKRYTPAITKLIKLIPADVGRQIIDMSQELLGPDFIADAQSVLENLVGVKKEIMINSDWYVRTALPYRTHDNRIEGVVVTYNNVTELKRAEERSSYLASFPQLNSNPVVEIDSSGKVTFCNPAAMETLESLGMDKGDVDAFLPPDLTAALRDWDKRNETTLYREIIIKDRVYGETIQLVPLFDVARIYANNITERKKSEESVQQRTAELERVNRELESFIYSASHDLRAPLRTISGFADIVAKRYAGQLDEKGSDYLLRICKGTARMSRIIDDLLHLSKVSRQEIQRKSVDLTEMASSIIADLREADPGRQVEAVIQKGLVVHADPGLMEVTLSNLLGNAWKFTSKTENARIEFGTFEQDGKTVFFLRDNGAGFEQKYAERMFWPFHRLHIASDFDGTGIGLAIVERVIHRHGGKIWAEGEAGKGTTIRFKLD
ncbi:MAG: PAS domain-containing protein [Nitrospirae bacterium]|nr:PAS domain-containing protein [Nitrospirota bacterium]